MAQRMDVRAGMEVKSRDGHRVGRVIGLVDDAFVVGKGVFYARDYRIPFRSVESIEGDVIHLSLNRDQLQKASTGEFIRAADRLDMGPESFAEARMDSAKFQDHDKYDVRTETEKEEAEQTRPIGFDSNAPSRE